MIYKIERWLNNTGTLAQVLYTFSDQAGNSAQCLFDVTVGKCKLKGITESGPTCRYSILGEG